MGRLSKSHWIWTHDFALRTSISRLISQYFCIPQGPSSIQSRPTYYASLHKHPARPPAPIRKHTAGPRTQPLHRGQAPLLHLPPRTPESNKTGILFLQNLHDFRQRVHRGNGSIRLATTMIGKQLFRPFGIKRFYARHHYEELSEWSVPGVLPEKPQVIPGCSRVWVNAHKFSDSL